MPVYQLECPDCGHRFKGMVMANTTSPSEWVCSKCKGRRAAPAKDTEPQSHPWDSGHGSGCPCCGG